MGEYKYDAYIVYNSEDDRDYAWVPEHLTKPLEQEDSQEGFKIFDPARDFIPGQGVIRNTQEYMEQSRTIIVVLSEAALEDSFSLQLEIAYHIAQARKQKVIVIRYHRLPSVIENAVARSLLENHVGIKWHPNSKNRSFWRRLLKNLNDKRSSNRISDGPTNAQGYLTLEEQSDQIDN